MIDDLKRGNTHPGIPFVIVFRLPLPFITRNINFSSPKKKKNRIISCRSPLTDIRIFDNSWDTTIEYSRKGFDEVI